MRCENMLKIEKDKHSKKKIYILIASTSGLVLFFCRVLNQLSATGGRYLISVCRFHLFPAETRAE